MVTPAPVEGLRCPDNGTSPSRYVLRDFVFPPTHSANIVRHKILNYLVIVRRSGPYLLIPIWPLRQAQIINQKSGMAQTTVPTDEICEMTPWLTLSKE